MHIEELPSFVHETPDISQHSLTVSKWLLHVWVQGAAAAGSSQCFLCHPCSLVIALIKLQYVSAIAFRFHWITQLNLNIFKLHYNRSFKETVQTASESMIQMPTLHFSDLIQIQST